MFLFLLGRNKVFFLDRINWDVAVVDLGNVGKASFSIGRWEEFFSVGVLLG